ncbi:MAG: choice-of-anchor B family protein, partial [Planctomycetes bacterium]|nr:choice-of-anchor B family protein [Planctomycetota bacterium]
YLFWNDELDELSDNVSVTTTYVGDVQDLAQPTLLTTFTSNMCSIDHNLIVRGNRLYEANYTTGLRVFDIQDINNVQEIAHFDTHPESNAIDFDGNWGVFAGFPSGLVILSDIQRGLFVLGEEPFYPVPNDMAKNRAITIGPGALGSRTALRIELVRMYVDNEEDPVNGCPVRTDLPDLSTFEGQVRWAGPPAVYSEDSEPLPSLVAAPLQCCPHFRDWSPQALSGLPGSKADSNVLSFFGAEIVPCSTYRVQAVDLQCEPFLDESCFSPPQTIQTAKWGDVWAPFGGSGEPTFTDIGKVVEKFKGIPFDPGPPTSGAPLKVQAMLRENILPLDTTLNFTDIGKVVNAFKKIPYSEVGPDTCPPCE